MLASRLVRALDSTRHVSLIDFAIAVQEKRTAIEAADDHFDGDAVAARHVIVVASG